MNAGVPVRASCQKNMIIHSDLNDVASVGNVVSVMINVFHII